MSEQEAEWREREARVESEKQGKRWRERCMGWRERSRGWRVRSRGREREREREREIGRAE